ncbi:hypothetical protein ACOZ4N_11180 [Halorientalis pallida]|uniref:hypothetical protein n=1 Tax=Halorientalis pallida TaxID=2479928 RepID=UPI003C6EFAD5
MEFVVRRGISVFDLRSEFRHSLDDSFGIGHRFDDCFPVHFFDLDLGTGMDPE